jgi:hypothetical protein
MSFTQHHFPFSLPAGSHCGVDGDADGWPDEDLPCNRDASFPIKETICRNIFQIFSR